MKPNFIDITAKIIAEIRTKTYIDKIDAEAIKEILQDSLNEYYDELQKYYDAGYDAAYDEGHSDGYDGGYDDGYTAGKSILEGDVDSAYVDGYDWLR